MKKKNVRKLNRNVVIPVIAVPLSVALGAVIATKIVVRINTVTDEEKVGFGNIIDVARRVSDGGGACFLLQATYLADSDEEFDKQYQECLETVADAENVARIYVNNGAVKEAANALYDDLDRLLPLIKENLEGYKNARENGEYGGDPSVDERPQMAEITGVAKEVSAQESSDKITNDDGEKIVEPEDESSDFMKLYTSYKKVSNSADELAETLKNL